MKAKSSVMIAVLLGACTPTVDKIRSLEAPKIFTSDKTFDQVTSCVGGVVVPQMGMSAVPIEHGTSFVYSHGASFGGVAAMLVEIQRTQPVKVDVTITGGPWLGKDNKLLRVVNQCL